MVNDNKIIISVGQSRHAGTWHPQKMLWSELVAKLATPIKTTENLRDYMQLKRSLQDDLKDVGGFVGGELKDNKRKASSVINRYIIALDADSIPAGGTENILKRLASLNCAYVLYSTRKHEAAAPRVRILFPLSRPATADEYEPIARKIASLIGMEFFDPTTFQANRLMYWPSISADSEYVYNYADAPWINTDGVLGMYSNWKNIEEWPEVPGILKQRDRTIKQQGDPTEKKGAVGAFCKVYGIDEAITRFLPNEYEKCDLGPNRYSYAEGSTAGGAITYDNKFLYSHHATDPASNILCNAFDLVRLHKFGDLDEVASPGTPTPSLPSYKAMTSLVYSEPAIATLINKEKHAQAMEEFNVDLSDIDNTDWLSRLQISKTTGRPLKTIDNIILILDNDPMLARCVGHDEMANKPRILKDLPWKRTRNGSKNYWDDADDASLRHYLEKFYGLDSKTKTQDAFSIACQRNAFHEIRNYLTGLEWDGENRLDTLLIDYLGADDNEYTRAVTRKTLVAAVARVMNPGTKFDNSLTLIGPQGTGKTTMLHKLGRGHHVEIGLSFKGKETSELIQGYWIVELGELKGLSRAEDADIKQFLSRTEDVYREAYGRHTKAFARQCVFIGTANNQNFLRDATGNRRFWPVDLMVVKPIKDVFIHLDSEVDQIWAEAVSLFKAGERLNLSAELEKEALAQQEEHREINPKEGQIKEFLDKKLPIGYNGMSLDQRRNFWYSKDEGTETRDRTCALEIWCELFNGDPKALDRRQAAEINGVLDVLEGWSKSKKAIRFNSDYGVQKGFYRDLIM